MSKQVRSVFILAICIYPRLLFAQTACCDDPTCRDKAKQVVVALGKATDFLGAFQPIPPMDVNGKKQFLDSLKKNEPSNYNAIKNAMNGYHDFISKDASQKDCVQREIADPANLTDDEARWVGYFITSFFSSGFRSPEFRKGFGILVHTGIGASSLFTNSEGFASLSGLLLSYTFTSKGQTTGGHVRALIGPGLYYSATKTYLLVHPRFEFRIKDLGSEVASIGCLKVIAQGGFQKDIQLAGLGIGIEISSFHVQVTENYLFNDSALFLQFGLGYSFAFNKQ
jgi:hypothetical protein